MTSAKTLLVIQAISMRHDIREVLEIEGYIIYGEVANGKEALDALDAHDDFPDLIIVEAHMPVMDGLELRKHLQTSPKYSDIPFLLLSIKQYQHLITRLDDLAISLPKSNVLEAFFTADAFLAKVHQMLNPSQP